MIDPVGFVDRQLTKSDHLVLQNLLNDIERAQTTQQDSNRLDACCSGTTWQNNEKEPTRRSADKDRDDVQTTIATLQAMNQSDNAQFEPAVFVLWDQSDMSPLFRRLLEPYIKWAQQAARNPTDVAMITHLILYFITSVPSAIYLYCNLTWIHGCAHVVMQFYYLGTYTLMMHQHIHMGGILAKRFPYNIVDIAFPYITDPLVGHTWNSYYHHHVKHHHVEGNGPDDLSSTIRYQRDDLLHLLQYIGRFVFLIWFDLPRYFFKKRHAGLAVRAALWETTSFAAIVTLAQWKFLPTLFVLLIPLMALRLGLMVGNWGQHAFVDEIEPDSDFRSSITLIDVASNRFCFNDGYHTSHHLNPRRHWREHPVAFLKQKQRYSAERALVFRNIDYIMITVRLVMKDYDHLAKCLVPIGDQIHMSMKERADMLRTKTRKFTEADVQRLFKS